MRAVKKPIEVRVWQLKQFAHKPVWIRRALDKGLLKFDRSSSTWKIKTLEGEMAANTDDYLIEGIRGEIYPCEKTIFEETYEVIE